MARRFAEPRERLAVLGATSPVGGHLKAALVARGVPSDKVELYGHGGDIAILSEYDGEARLVQPALELDASRYGAVFVCEAGHDAGALTAAARGGTVVVDLSGTLPIGDGADGRLAKVPHPVTLLLHPILAALDAELGLLHASAFVMRPAADFGEPGLEELREQTVHLLRFESTPTDVFGRQLAFSVVPEHLFPEDDRDVSARVAEECRELLGSDARLSVSMALVPTFLGHAIAIHAAVSRGTAEDALDALRRVKGVRVTKDPDVGTTLDAPEGPGLLVARGTTDPDGTVRLWVLGSDAAAIAAVRALDVASAAGVFVNAS
jgi:aspartate-semialdehyde dehydrogenase